MPTERTPPKTCGKSKPSKWLWSHTATKRPMPYLSLPLFFFWSCITCKTWKSYLEPSWSRKQRHKPRLHLENGNVWSPLNKHWNFGMFLLLIDNENWCATQKKTKNEKLSHKFGHKQARGCEATGYARCRGDRILFRKPNSFPHSIHYRFQESVCATGGQLLFV